MYESDRKSSMVAAPKKKKMAVEKGSHVGTIAKETPVTPISC
jgi:hypothetical protein